MIKILGFLLLDGNEEVAGEAEVGLVPVLKSLSWPWERSSFPCTEAFLSSLSTCSSRVFIHE